MPKRFCPLVVALSFFSDKGASEVQRRTSSINSDCLAPNHPVMITTPTGEALILNPPPPLQMILADQMQEVNFANACESSGLVQTEWEETGRNPKMGKTCPKDPSVLKILRRSNLLYFATAVAFYYLYRFLPLFLRRKTRRFWALSVLFSTTVPDLFPVQRIHSP